jgi:hypothetical protein
LRDPPRRSRACSSTPASRRYRYRALHRQPLFAPLQLEVHTAKPATRANAVDPAAFLRSVGVALLGP